MDANHLATKGDIAELNQQLAHLLQLVQAPPALTDDDYLSLKTVARLTEVSVRTVKGWIKNGKPDRQGKRIIRLFAVEFSPGYQRVPRAALLAYALATDFTTANLKHPPPMRLAG